MNQPVYLHWLPIELLSVAAHRMLIHVQLYGDGDPSFNNRLLNIDVSTREGVMELFSECFPGKVSNEANIEEPAVLYILRHTQMLPRQVLKIFDIVLKHNVRNNQRYLPVSQESVVWGIQQIVNELAHGVCGAYSYQYPVAWETCRHIVSRLPHTFKQSDLDSIFGKFVKNRDRIGQYLSEVEFSRMLVEVGCIGEITDSTEHYFKSQFEYNSIGELIFSQDAQLCVHPMFRGPSGGRDNDSGCTRAIYPIGADPYESLERLGA